MQHKILSAKSFAKNIRSTVYLFKKLWKQRTTALLHSPREIDKTTFALDIAQEIVSQGEEVLYIDTQSHLDDHCERLSAMEGLSVLIPEFESPDDPTDYADLVISAIEEVVASTDIRTFIIDSVTRIAALSFGRNASAAYIMKRLVALQVRCGLSLLVIANDTTKATTRSLIALSDSEFSETSEFSELSECSECSEISECSLPSQPRPKLTRQQRRARQRKKAKLMRALKASESAVFSVNSEPSDYPDRS